ncbi:hypothetical protein K474DRAFT_1077138 [Panus rudis PR-1116 ss-1]|nr:hypothetical protein K474DRAFT_1077138 [Panus rudis PR-1116 ss-1]
MLKPSDLVGHYRERYESCHYDHQIKAFTGCSQNVFDVMMGTPVFQLDRDPNTNERTNLAIVIDSLMKLCQKHWQSLDVVAMAKYASSNEQPEDTALLCPSIMPNDVLFEEEPFQDPEHDTPTAEAQPQSPFLDHKEIIKVLKDCLGKRGWPTYVDRTKDDQVVQAKRVYGDLRPIQFTGHTPTLAPNNIGASSAHRIDSLPETAYSSDGRGDKRIPAESSTRRGSKRNLKAADMYKSASEDGV